MIIQVLHCPHCHGTDIVRHGKSPEGKHRYRCRQCREGRGRPFLLEYTYAGQSPEVQRQIVGMAMNASGIRDTRVIPTRDQLVVGIGPAMGDYSDLASRGALYIFGKLELAAIDQREPNTKVSVYQRRPLSYHSSSDKFLSNLLLDEKRTRSLGG